VARLDLSLGELFQQPKNEIVMAAVQKLRTHISGNFDTNIFPCKLNSLAKVNLDLWMFTLLVVMIMGAMIILLIGLCCWKKCCQESQLTNYPMPSTPPAPLILNQHLNLIRR
jgi:hypothetical protein